LGIVVCIRRRLQKVRGLALREKLQRGLFAIREICGSDRELDEVRYGLWLDGAIDCVKTSETRRNKVVDQRGPGEKLGVYLRIQDCTH
jgi:hypothetical protein